MLQRFLSVIVCMASNGKHQKQVHGFYFLKKFVDGHRWNQRIEDYIYKIDNFSLSFLNYLL